MTRQVRRLAPPVRDATSQISCERQLRIGIVPLNVCALVWAVHGRTGHGIFAGARGGREDPSASNLACDFLQMESRVRRPRCVGRQAASRLQDENGDAEARCVTVFNHLTIRNRGGLARGRILTRAMKRRR